MVHFVIGIFVFIAIVAVTAVLFSGWAIYGIIRVIGRGIGALIASFSSPAPRPPVVRQMSGHARCPRARCHAHNPSGAIFCRRCGERLLDNGAGVAIAAPHRRQVYAKPAPARAANRVAS